MSHAIYDMHIPLNNNRTIQKTFKTRSLLKYRKRNVAQEASLGRQREQTSPTIEEHLFQVLEDIITQKSLQKDIVEVKIIYSITSLGIRFPQNLSDECVLTKIDKISCIFQFRGCIMAQIHQEMPCVKFKQLSYDIFQSLKQICYIICVYNNFISTEHILLFQEGIVI